MNLCIHIQTRPVLCTSGYPCSYTKSFSYTRRLWSWNWLLRCTNITSGRQNFAPTESSQGHRNACCVTWHTTVGTQLVCTADTYTNTLSATKTRSQTQFKLVREAYLFTKEQLLAASASCFHNFSIGHQSMLTDNNGRVLSFIWLLHCTQSGGCSYICVTSCRSWRRSHALVLTLTIHSEPNNTNTQTKFPLLMDTPLSTSSLHTRFRLVLPVQTTSAQT